MIVYFILAVAFGVFAILFATDKYFSTDYKNCPSEEAKKIYKKGGTIICGLFFLGFLFMGFYDFSINIDYELIILEGFGLFILLFAVVSFVFTIMLYHTKMVEFSKEGNEDANNKDIKDYCENLEKNSKEKDSTKEESKGEK